VKRNAVVLAIVILAVTFMLYMGRRMAGPPRQGGVTGGALVGEFRGQQAPDFELKALDGSTIRLSDYRGKAVVLNFWATWCGPCKVEMPWFEEFQKQYGPQGLVVLGVAMDDSQEDVQKFIQEMGVHYTIVMGRNAVADAYGVQAFPGTFYIGRDGRVVEWVTGLAGHGEIEANIKRSLGEGAAPVNAATPAPPASKPQEAKPQAANQ
jgi:cytochrome c biogenesis protein CcmG/thiol:disulfide interchange protein DsbE